LYAFSTENWNRSKEEVDYLMQLLESCLIDNLSKYDKDGTRVRVIGQRDRLPKSLQEAIKKYSRKNYYHSR
jgi:undecaprenyl diphosphate synthase